MYKIRPIDDIVSKCEYCGIEWSEPKALFRKRVKYYCSRNCANKHYGELKNPDFDKEEYMRKYWDKPDNKERKKKMGKIAQRQRMGAMGESYVIHMLIRCRKRAESKGMEFSLTTKDVTIPKFCPILGIELKVNEGRGDNWNSPSLDRIDNSKGYIPGNVHVISKRANSIKSDASLEELKLMYLWAEKYLSANPE